MFDATPPFVMREPCRGCRSTEGRIDPRGGQDCVYCATCGRYAYNAPRVETGRRQRSVSTVHEGIRPSVRAKVLERASGRCELCGAGGRVLHVSHLFSVADGVEAGFTEDQLNHEDNLAVFCEECNIGQGRQSVHPRLWLALCHRRLNQRRG